MQVSNAEALAYAQSAAGVQFVRVKFSHPFNDDPGTKTRSLNGTGKNFVYKVAPELGSVSVGDELVVQVIDEVSYSVARVQEVLDGPPASDEYSYETKPLKWAVSIIDTKRARELRAADREALKTISKAVLKSRIGEVNAALGFDVSQVVSPQSLLPGRQVIEEAVVVVEDEPDEEEDDFYTAPKTVKPSGHTPDGYVSEDGKRSTLRHG